MTGLKGAINKTMFGKKKAKKIAKLSTKKDEEVNEDFVGVKGKMVGGKKH